jgi:hypothetical protein
MVLGPWERISGLFKLVIESFEDWERSIKQGLKLETNVMQPMLL